MKFAYRNIFCYNLGKNTNRRQVDFQIQDPWTTKQNSSVATICETSVIQMLLLTSLSVLEFIVVFPVVCHRIFFFFTRNYKVKK